MARPQAPRRPMSMGSKVALGVTGVALAVGVGYYLWSQSAQAAAAADQGTGSPTGRTGVSTTNALPQGQVTVGPITQTNPTGDASSATTTTPSSSSSSFTGGGGSTAGTGSSGSY